MAKEPDTLLHQLKSLLVYSLKDRRKGKEGPRSLPPEPTSTQPVEITRPASIWLRRCGIGVFHPPYVPFMSVRTERDDDMQGHPHLFRRGNVDHWRRRSRRFSTGIVDIKLPLGTTDLRIAHMSCRRISVEGWAICHGALTI